MHGVSFRTRSLSGTDYVMAKWNREGEGGQNKTEGGRETGPFMAFPSPSARRCQNLSLSLISVICHFSLPYLVSYQTDPKVTFLEQ